MEGYQLSIGERFYNIYMTVLQMLDDRGYQVDSDKLEMELEDFKIQYEITDDDGTEKIDCGNLNDVLRESKDPNIELPPIGVFFSDSILDKIGLGKVLQYMKQNGSLSRCIVIIPDGGMRNMIKKHIENLKTRENRQVIEVFEQSKLAFNITRHMYVPKHIPLSVEETDEVLKHYGITREQLPCIFVDDPVALYLGLEVGQVVKIVRKVDTAGIYISYRHVISRT